MHNRQIRAIKTSALTLDQSTPYTQSITKLKKFHSLIPFTFNRTTGWGIGQENFEALTGG